MEKRVFIVHGWGGNSNELLHKLLKERFSKKGFHVFVPEMPNSNKPKINEWVSHLSRIAGKVDENTYFIGHSIGCQTIMRYLEKLDEKDMTGEYIFIAGWFNLDNMESDEEKEIANPWIKNKINLKRVKNIVKEIKVYLSSNEFYGLVGENTKIFKEKLSAKVIIEKDMGHFTDEEGKEKLSKFVSKLDF